MNYGTKTIAYVSTSLSIVPQAVNFKKTCRVEVSDFCPEFDSRDLSKSTVKSDYHGKILNRESLHILN